MVEAEVEEAESADGEGAEEVDLDALNPVYQHSCGVWVIVEPGADLVADCCGDDDGEWEGLGWTDAGPGVLPVGAIIRFYNVGE